MITAIRKGTNIDGTQVLHRHHRQASRRLNLSILCPASSTALSTRAEYRLCVGNSMSNVRKLAKSVSPFSAITMPGLSYFGFMITGAIATVSPRQGTCGTARSSKRNTSIAPPPPPPNITASQYLFLSLSTAPSTVVVGCFVMGRRCFMSSQEHTVWRRRKGNKVIWVRNN